VVCVVENCEDLPIDLRRLRRGEFPCPITVRIAHKADCSGQIRVGPTLTLSLVTWQLGWWIGECQRKELGADQSVV
jgi:hypothetical protein